MLKKALFSLVTCMAIIAPVATNAATDPTDPLTAQQPTVSASAVAVSPADWTAPSPFVTEPIGQLTIFPPNE